MIKNAGYVLNEPQDGKEILNGINHILKDYSYYSKEAKKTFNKLYSKKIFIEQFDKIITNGV